VEDPNAPALEFVLVEHARSLAGVSDETHAEEESGGTPIITQLACSLQGKMITVLLRPNSRLASLHGCETVDEMTTCSYGLAPAHQYIADAHGQRIVGVDDAGEARAIERPTHPFFIGTLYQPQLRSQPAHPHPVSIGLLKAAVET